MTAPHVPTDRLHDYVDDLLCREERMLVERHLAVCPTCRAEVADLRALLADLGELPAAIAPERDLLPGVHAAIDASAARRTRVQWLAAAAAIVVLAAAAAGVRWITVPAVSPDGAVASSGTVDDLWRHQSAEMERLLTYSRQTLDPATVRVLEENLRIIDRALTEARAALRSDPGNPVLEELLLATHRKRLDLLRGAARGGT